MYADDTELYSVHESLEAVERDLQQDISNLIKWITSNKLNLNISKAADMLIGSEQRVFNKVISISADGLPLHEISSTNLTIDRYVKVLNSHILSILTHFLFYFNKIGF